MLAVRRYTPHKGYQMQCSVCATAVPSHGKHATASSRMTLCATDELANVHAQADQALLHSMPENFNPSQNTEAEEQELEQIMSAEKREELGTLMAVKHGYNKADTYPLWVERLKINRNLSHGAKCSNKKKKVVGLYLGFIDELEAAEEGLSDEVKRKFGDFTTILDGKQDVILSVCVSKSYGISKSFSTCWRVQ